MKKSLYFLAAAALVMTGCSSDDYVGGPSHVETTTGSAIAFSGLNPNITRAVNGTEYTEGDAATKLGNKFNVYGTKTLDANTTLNVFAHNDLSDANTPFWVWYNGQGGSTETNEKGWEYVGEAGIFQKEDGKLTIPNLLQEIKYWDFAASQYDFIAWSATPVMDYSADPAVENDDLTKITNVTTDGFDVQTSVKGLAGLYVADYKVVTDAGYNKTVTFTFRSAAAKVRLGIYETVPGYAVRNLRFHYVGDNGEETSTTDAWLTGKFIGPLSNKENSYTARVSFSKDGDNKDMAVVTPTNAFGKVFNFGTFAAVDEELGTTSANPTWANHAELGDPATHYMDVIPNIANGNDNIADMILHVDYELFNSTTNEVIKVSNAKAVVPANYMTWNPNFAYTYLFKISDNTNGTTGGEDDPAGLYPITFDAVVVETVVDETQGTITTVDSPSITTYQDGSVIEGDNNNGIVYKANSDIYVTVQNPTEQELLTLTDIVKLFTVPVGTTERDCYTLSATDKVEVAANISVPTTDMKLNRITIAAGKYAQLTGLTAGQTYAFEYTYAGYKLTKDVEPVVGKTYYTKADGTGEKTFAAGEDFDAPYYEAAANLKAYKVIKVSQGR